MQPTDDHALLRQYSENHSDEAFAALVTRHINLIYSVALRQVGHPQNAEEITQAVFIILAKKAAGLHHEQALSSWLFQTTRLTAQNFIRSEMRRRHREQEVGMQTSLNESGGEVWANIAPLLDDAVAALRKKDRQAVLLRFYEGRNLREVGSVLGASEDAAEKRVSRALEKLRNYFTKHGVNSTAAIIAGVISANSVQAAPAVLAKSVTAMAVAKGAAASTSTLTLIQGALKIMAWTKTKTTIAAGVAAILVATSTTTIGVKLAQAHRAVAEPATGLSPIMVNITADIASDGTIHLQGTMEDTNNTSRTISADNINDGNGIDRAVDESGKPMKITKRSRGGIFVMLNKAVPPGGKVSYTVEGRVAGFIKENGAGEYEVGPEGDIGNVTEAHVIQVWRLPAGATLLEKNSDVEATTNAGRIELRIDKAIPPNGRFPNGFRYRFPANAQ
jgi:RNA polymerase sigma factor (sigma-70 family)